MKYLKLFENFIEDEENLPGGDIPFDDKYGVDTSWTVDGVTITLNDINSYLDENKVPVVEIDTASIEDILIDTERDPERVDSASLEYPIILSTLNGDFYSVLDGQHRVVKSIKMGLPTIKARILYLDTAPEYRKIFVR